MSTTIHAMVEKDNSFDTQRMLAHGIQAAQTTLYKLIQQRDAFAFTSPYRGHTTTTHATYDFAQFSTNAAIDTSMQQTRFTVELQNSIRSICHRAVSSRPARCRVAQQARVQTAHRLIIVFSKILKTYDSIMQRCRTLQNTTPLPTTKLHKCIQLLPCS